MKFSRRETFFWLKAAHALATIGRRVGTLPDSEQRKFLKGEIPPMALARVKELSEKKFATEKEIQDYLEVQRSLNRAMEVLLVIGQRAISIDELDERRNESSGLTYDLENGLRVSVRKFDLARVAATGNKHEAGYSESTGIVTKADLRRATKRKRRPLFDANQIGVVPRFLVEHWCGYGVSYGFWLEIFETRNKKLRDESGVMKASTGHYVCKKSPSFFFIPPLCFITNGALARFVAFALGKDDAHDKSTSTTAVRKWVSRLGLKHAASPKIIDVKIAGDQIHFLP